MQRHYNIVVAVAQMKDNPQLPYKELKQTLKDKNLSGLVKEDKLLKAWREFKAAPWYK